MAIKLDKSFNKGNLVKNMARNYKLVTHLDKALADFDEPFEFKYESKETDDAWHPSGDCMPSPSELYWKVKDPTPWDISVMLRKAFMVGHFWHQLLQHIVLNKLEFCGPEDIERRGSKVWGNKLDLYLSDDDTPPYVYGDPYRWATGSGDIAPCIIPGHGEYVVDFKTMNGRDFSKNTVPGWCADKYEAQINIYMDFFDIDKALIVAIQKDSPHNFKEFEYERNQELIGCIYDKWEFVSDCLNTGVEPSELDNETLSLDGLFTGPVE